MFFAHQFIFLGRVGWPFYKVYLLDDRETDEEYIVQETEIIFGHSSNVLPPVIGPLGMRVL